MVVNLRNLWARFDLTRPRQGSIILGLLMLTGCDVVQDTPCTVTRVASGDTVVLSCEDGETFPVRIAGIEAPNIDAPACAAEHTAARTAYVTAEDLFARAQSISIVPTGLRDGVREARITLGTQNAAQMLLATGQVWATDAQAPQFCEGS